MAEPDIRFTLANERTFLAWVRTAIGLVAAGVAVFHLFEVTVATTTLSLVILAAGALSGVAGYTHFPMLTIGDIAALATVAHDAGAASVLVA